MPVTFTPQVKSLLRAAGYTDAQIKTQEVKVTQAQNQANVEPNPLEERDELSPRFSENVFDLPTEH